MNKLFDQIWYATKPVVIDLAIAIMVLVPAYHFWPVATLTALMLLGMVAAIAVPPAVILLAIIWFVALRWTRYSQQNPAPENNTVFVRNYARNYDEYLDTLGYNRKGLPIMETVSGTPYTLSVANGAIVLTEHKPRTGELRESVEVCKGDAITGCGGILGAQCPEHEQVWFGGKTQ